MICSKCNKETLDGAAFCMHCGTKILGECRKCKRVLPQAASFCPYCGYPTSGNVCVKCGTVAPDGASFCGVCGQRLTVARQDASVASVAGQSMQNTRAKGGDSGMGKKAARAVRIVVLPVLLLCMFISGFFGMFRQRTYLFDGMTIDTGLDKPITFNGAVTVDFTGFDIVRGMFTLIYPPSEKEAFADFQAFLKKYFRGKSITDIDTEDVEEALQKYGLMRLIISGEVPGSVIAQVVIWGVHTLLLITLSFVFLILAVLHAVQVLLRKKTGFYKGERGVYALMAALAFAFLITGAGGMAGGSFGILFLSCIGLAYSEIHDVVVENKPRLATISSVRLGVCTLAVVLITVFISGALVNAKGYDVETGLRKDYLFESLNDRESYEFDVGEAMNSGAYNAYLSEGFKDDTLTKRQKKELLMMFASPAALCALKDMPNGYNVGCMVSAWILFVFNLGASVFTVLLLFALLSEDANNRKRKMAYFIGLIVCTLGIMGTSIALAKLANAMTEGFLIALSYSLSALPVIAVVLAVLAPIVYFVLLDAEKNKPMIAPAAAAPSNANSESIGAQAESAPTQAQEEKEEA